MSTDTDKVAQMLSHMGADEAAGIIDSIASKDSKLAANIQQSMFPFETILQLSTKDMALLHQNIDKTDHILAMKGANDKIKAKLLEGFSSRKKQMLLEEYELMGKVKRSEADAAKERIAQILRQLVTKEIISLDEDWVD